MKCIDCLYENNCSLREIAQDLVGCEGHSKERPPQEGEVRCSYCKSWVDKSQTFQHEINKHYVCFNCY